MRVLSIARTLWPITAQPAWRGLAGALLWLMTSLLSGCDLQQDVDVELPNPPAQLVVECYLEPGKIPEMTVTETVPYLSLPEPVLLTDVTVTLTGPNGRVENLRFRPGQNSTTKKLYTHRGTRALAINPGDTWQLRVTDTKGREVTGTATMPATVPIETVEWRFNDRPANERRAYLLMWFNDPANTPNFYRFLIHRDSISENLETDREFDDRLLDGQRIPMGTGFDYAVDDTLVVSLYHLERPYYNFIQSIEEAQSANGNPFGQPAQVRSTVQGGIGVFTILSYQRQKVIIRP